MAVTPAEAVLFRCITDFRSCCAVVRLLKRKNPNLSTISVPRSIFDKIAVELGIDNRNVAIWPYGVQIQYHSSREEWSVDDEVGLDHKNRVLKQYKHHSWKFISEKGEVRCSP